MAVLLAVITYLELAATVEYLISLFYETLLVLELICLFERVNEETGCA